MNAYSPAVPANVPIVVTLLVGLLIAFAVQLLLTSFGAAVGITALGYLPLGRSSKDSPPADADSDRSEEEDSKIPGVIGIAVGLGTLITVNTVLFVACFLAVKLSLVNSAILGAILGLVIWSGYFLVVVWVGSSAVGSLLGSIASTLTAGVQGLISTTSAVFGRKDPALPKPLRKQIAAAEAMLKGLQGELKEAQDNRASLQDTLQDYLATLQSPKPDLATLRQEFSHALQNSGQPLATEIDRPALVELVSRRTDFSKQDVHQIVSELETVWREALGGTGTIAALTTLLASAQPQELTAETLKPHLKAATPSESGSNSTIEPKQLFKQLVRTVRQRVDLSDLDVGKVVQQLQTLLGSEGLESEPKVPTSIGADVEDFLLNAAPWQLTQKSIPAEFKAVIFDPEANPIVVRQQLEALNLEDFATLLHQRDDLDESKISSISDRLEAVRQEVLEALKSIESQQQFQSFIQQAEDYLQFAQKSDLKPAHLKRQLIQLLHHSGVVIEQWTDALQPLDNAAIQQALQAHTFKPEELEALTEQVVTVRDRLIRVAQTPAPDRQSKAEALWLQLGEFVRNPDQKLTAPTIQRQFKTLSKSAEDVLVQRPFDRATVEQWLTAQQNLSAKRRHQIVNQLEKAWNNLADELPAIEPSPPSRVLQVLTDYLKTLDGSRLDLETFGQDLLAHLQQHQVGLGELGLAVASSWGAIESRLQQHPDLSAEQLQQLQQSIYALAKLPRRWAVRTQGKTTSLWDSLTDYLRHAELTALDSIDLQSSLKYLAKVAPTQLRSLGNAIPTFDPATLVAFLVDRGDLTATEAEEIGGQVADTLQKATEQAQTLKQQSQETLARTLNRFSQALDTVELPTLDADRLKQELRNLVADPQAKWETLNARLGNFNRDAIAQLLQTRDDLSESVVTQLVDQVDAVRLGISQQVNHLQQEAEQRLEDLKQQAQHQAAAAQKAVAIAAWWLFSTALTAATTAAISGALAADGWNWLSRLGELLSLNRI